MPQTFHPTRGRARGLASLLLPLLACGAAQAHDGITPEAMAWLALLAVSVPLIGIGMVLWPLAVFARRPSSWGDPLTGWRKLASAVSLPMLLAGLALAGFVLSQTTGKVMLKEIRMRRAEQAAEAEADAKRVAEDKARAAGIDETSQCLARQWFVGSWDVRRSGADYSVWLNADGTFELGTVQDNPGNLRLAPQGRWRVEGRQLVWLLPGRSGEQRIAQPVSEQDGNAFSLQDQGGSAVRYQRNGQAVQAFCGR